MKKLGMEKLLAHRPCRGCQGVLAMIAELVLSPGAKRSRSNGLGAATAQNTLWTITDDRFSYSRREKSIAAESSLDGLYVVRTSVTPEVMDADTVVRCARIDSNQTQLTESTPQQRRYLELLNVTA